MQAIGLIDDQRHAFRNDALLGTYRHAGLASDAGVCDKISFSLFLRSSKCEGCSFNGLLGKVEPLTCALVYLEYRQSLP